MIQKARIVCYGVDDELRDDASSIFSTDIKSLNYPVPAPIAPNLVPIIENTRTGVEAVGFTTRLNTKRFKYSLNPNLKNLNLSNNARLVIESITIPNVISDLYLQSKCVNNVILKLKGISNHNIWDSSTKGKGSSVIFTCPILLNTQGFGTTLETNVAGIGASQPDLITSQQKARLNCDNNGYLFINTSPSTLYNFPITEDFFKNGVLEFELIYDIGNIRRLTNLINGSISSITITNAGEGYTGDATINFAGGGGDGAVAVAEVGYPVSTSIYTISNIGSGYTSNPVAVITLPGFAGTQASAVVVRGFPVGTITIGASGGAGYTSAPTVVFSAPTALTAGITGQVRTATGTANIDAGTGKVVSITLTDAGLNYSTAPTITLSGGGFTTAATATCVLSTTGTIRSLTITAGSGYTEVPLIEIYGGGGTDGEAVLTLGTTAGTIRTATIVNRGSGYTSIPTLLITGGGGTTTATATATIASTEAHYSIIPQSLNINTDKFDLEAFMISFVVVDEEDDDKIYKDKKLLNKINKLLLDKPV